jgi:hypothetical protein
VVNLMSTTVGRCNPRVQRIARTRHSEELIYWRKWQAPSLTIMKPSRYRAYEKDKEWERNDAETSARWLANFADDYVVRLESRVKKLPGELALKSAKQERSLRPNKGEAEPQNQILQRLQRVRDTGTRVSGAKHASSTHKPSIEAGGESTSGC